MTLARARDAVLAARTAPNADRAWMDGLTALGRGLHLDRYGRSGVPLSVVIELLETGATIAVFAARREVIQVDGTDG